MKYRIKFDIDLLRNPYKGLYIAFEGIDGSGKSTQVAHLEKYLRNKEKKVVVTSEPRKEGSVVGILIHQVLKSKIKIPSASLQHLYTADRIINHKEIVEPALKSGKVVLSHRCLWSNVPYGLLDKGVTNFNSVDTKLINITQGLMSMYHQFIIPDITFYLKVSVETAMQRISNLRKEKEIYEKKEKLAQIKSAYEWQLKQFPNEFTIIDGEKSEEKIAKKIQEYINKKLEM